MKMLDLYCGEGGAAVGYNRAGFDDITGIDINPQPNYPFKFIQADAIEFLKEHGKEFDFIHASPPCQAHSTLRFVNKSKKYKNHIPALRKLLESSGKYYVIENVVGSPLKNTALLCGSMFNLLVRRHRLFEANFLIITPSCQHYLYKEKKYRYHNKEGRLLGKKSAFLGVYGKANYKNERKQWEDAMGIDWMTLRGLTQAIPPAYTEYIGKIAMEYLINCLTIKE